MIAQRARALILDPGKWGSLERVLTKDGDFVALLSASQPFGTAKGSEGVPEGHPRELTDLTKDGCDPSTEGKTGYLLWDRENLTPDR